MKTIKNFDELISYLSGRGMRRRVAVIWASDESTQGAVGRALDLGFIEAIMVGCREQLEQLPLFKANAAHVTYVDTDDRDEAARLAVGLVRDGKADILMKGLINTDNVLHAVLNKEEGIMTRGNVLSHITVANIPSYERLLFFTDAAVIPYPTHEQRVKQVSYIATMCHAFGIDEPRVALAHCSEKVNEKFFPFTVGYRELASMSQQGEFGRCIVDGPLDVKTACNKHSMDTKGIVSPIDGAADAIVFPDIEAANAFYKTLTLFGGAKTAGILQGAQAPVVVPSRSDSTDCKFYSLAVAAAL